jgi:hypothetical protein
MLGPFKRLRSVGDDLTGPASDDDTAGFH